eukprot:TRINITY_DN996_c0_g1_i6.p1 TRINITY_DN996_c0_g1~~TRINITY_DN996_c0_g1_i6.p1  ORF type:complete len:236 (+),score=25.25 TRINITY_DN996_c0_g1_i6:150-857(+)
MCIRDSSYSGRVFQYSVFVYYKSMTTNECMYSRMKLERCDPDVRSLDSHRYNVIVVTSTIDSTNTRVVLSKLTKLSTSIPVARRSLTLEASKVFKAFEVTSRSLYVTDALLESQLVHAIRTLCTPAGIQGKSLTLCWATRCCASWLILLGSDDTVVEMLVLSLSPTLGVSPASSARIHRAGHEPDDGSEQHHHKPVSYTHLRAHETPEHLVCRLLLEKKKKKKKKKDNRDITLDK